MLSAQVEFERRELEIDEFLNHLEMLEQQVGLSATLVNTMKSSVLLMMYNLVESTMTNLMQDIFDHLKTANIAFDALNSTMKTVVLGYTKRRKPQSLVEKMSTTATGLVVACFERTDIFSGNIDCRRIATTLKDLGIPTRHQYEEPILETIKDERNFLAHGQKSFSDCGKFYSAPQLREYHERIKLTLGRVIGDFEEFLTSKAYA